MEITVKSVDNGWILQSYTEEHGDHITAHLDAEDLLWEIVEKLELPYDRFSDPSGKREKLVVGYVAEDVVLP